MALSESAKTKTPPLPQNDMSQFDFFKTTMPKTRPADFYLGGLDGAVFMDFCLNEKSQIALVRISFDGFGCCQLPKQTTPLSNEDSVSFVRGMQQEDLNQAAITTLVQQLLRQNQAHIWAEALERYQLLG